jgi:hypothetical protein
MLANAGMLMLYTFLVMSSLIGLGIVGGLVIAKLRMRRFMKAFKEG